MDFDLDLMSDIMVITPAPPAPRDDVFVYDEYWDVGYTDIESAE